MSFENPDNLPAPGDPDGVYAELAGSAFAGDVSISGGQLVVGGTTELGTLTIYGHDASDEALVVRGSNSQTANMLAFQNSAGTLVSGVQANGHFIASNYWNNGGSLTLKTTTYHNLYLGTNNANRMIMLNSGEVIVGSTATALGTFTIYGHATNDEALYVQAITGQTADILRVGSVDNGDLLTVDADGAMNIADGLGIHGVTAPAQAAHIADPAGGATVDAEARTAINSILVALENIGVQATS
jgi:hypothetical protein